MPSRDALSWLPVVAGALIAAVGACSSANSSDNGLPSGGGDSGGEGGAAGSGAMGGTAGGGGVLVDGGLEGGLGGGTACPEETQYVYVVTAEEDLYKFDPPSVSFSHIGHLSCPNAGIDTPYSMSVDRKGIAWVVYTNGKIYHVDVKTAGCSATAFVPNQSGFMTFGMGFSSNAVGTAEETLFVSPDTFSGSTSGLAMIDTETLQLIPIHTYDQIDARAELTGTGDARLFGAFEGEPYIVAEIEKSTAHILSQAPQNVINYSPGGSNFAFAFWGGDFWLFVGPGTSTDVFHYEVATGNTTKVSTVSYEIVGAGVSTCAPVVPPT